ncbi:hypothetical protein AKJ16_DCAP12699 [Drosera capensis]
MERELGITCHHRDSTIREKIQASIFSKAITNVSGSSQSSWSSFGVVSSSVPIPAVSEGRRTDFMCFNLSGNIIFCRSSPLLPYFKGELPTEAAEGVLEEWEEPSSSSVTDVSRTRRGMMEREDSMTETSYKIEKGCRWRVFKMSRPACFQVGHTYWSNTFMITAIHQPRRKQLLSLANQQEGN